MNDVLIRMDLHWMPLKCNWSLCMVFCFSLNLIIWIFHCHPKTRCLLRRMWALANWRVAWKKMFAYVFYDGLHWLMLLYRIEAEFPFYDYVTQEYSWELFGDNCRERNSHAPFAFLSPFGSLIESVAKIPLFAFTINSVLFSLVQRIYCCIYNPVDYLQIFMCLICYSLEILLCISMRLKLNSLRLNTTCSPVQVPFSSQSFHELMCANFN